MPKKVLIIKNINREGPGIIEKIMQENLIHYQIVSLDKGEIFPQPKNYAAVIILGGPASANDQTEKMKNEIKKVQICLSQNIPFLGICLGMQVLVKAVGGKVFKSPVSEIGFRGPASEFFEIEVIPQGYRDPLLFKLGSKLKVFHLHNETVELTEEIKLLGKGKYCTNQIVKVSQNAYGLQGHFELTTRLLDTWMAQDPQLRRLNRASLLSDFARIRAQYTRTGHQLFTNFFKLAGLIKN